MASTMWLDDQCKKPCLSFIQDHALLLVTHTSPSAQKLVFVALTGRFSACPKHLQPCCVAWASMVWPDGQTCKTMLFPSHLQHVHMSMHFAACAWSHALLAHSDLCKLHGQAWHASMVSLQTLSLALITAASLSQWRQMFFRLAH